VQALTIEQARDAIQELTPVPAREVVELGRGTTAWLSSSTASGCFGSPSFHRDADAVLDKARFFTTLRGLQDAVYDLQLDDRRALDEGLAALRDQLRGA
jgi:hypothetical protein